MIKINIKLYDKNNKKELELTFHYNSNNKFKISEINYDVKKLLSLIFDFVIEEKFYLELNNLKYEITNFNYKDLLQIFNNFINNKEKGEQFQIEVLNKEFSFFLLRLLLELELVEEQLIETRFLNINLVKNEDEKYLLKINENDFITDFIKFFNIENILEISFKNNYIEEFKLNIGETVNIISTINNSTINKKIKLLNYYYDEINKCYFLRGENV